MSESVKRKLTKLEIREILSFITDNEYIPNSTAEAISGQLSADLEDQLSGIEIYPELIPEFRAEIIKYYNETMIQPGECVGVVTAQSIGEKQTQGALNSFHTAGSADKQPITSVFAELLNATKKLKAPRTHIRFRRGNSTIAKLRETIGNSIVALTLEKISDGDFAIVMDKKDEPWYDAYKLMYNDDFSSCFDCVTVKINTEMLYEYKLTLEEVANSISAEYADLFCVHSPDCFAQLDIFVNMENIEIPEDMVEFIGEGDAKNIHMDEVVVPMLRNMVIRGIPGIKDMFYVKDTDNTWMVETHNSFRQPKNSLSNFKEVLAHPDVDMSKVRSNNVWDIYHTLGIEAAREFLIQEFSAIMEGINRCHVSVLVDKMTFEGTISSMSRYTMKKQESGPFGKASFEETMDNFLQAALFGETETTSGVSASIICGKKAPIGTGLCSLKMNLGCFMGEEKDEDDEDISVKEMPSVEEETETEIDENSDEENDDAFEEESEDIDIDFGEDESE